MTKRSLLTIWIVSVLLTACNMSPPPSSAPTATQQPTSTPEPTLTSTPTNTPSPTPTSTPDIPATQAAQATESAAEALTELDKYLGDDSGIPYQDGKLAWQQSESLTVRLTGPDDDFVAIADDLALKDFIFKADVRWEASGLLVCGCVFRSEPDLFKGRQYIFSYLRLSGLPAWSIDVNRYGRYQSTVSDFRTSGALDLSNGSTNRFIIVARDNEFTVYINNTREGRFYDNSKQLAKGVFGFFGAQDSGDGACEFDNAWIWSLDK